MFERKLVVILLLCVLVNVSQIDAQELGYRSLAHQLNGKQPAEVIKRLEEYLVDCDKESEDHLRAIDRLARELAAIGENSNALKWITRGKVLAENQSAKFLWMKLLQLESAVCCEMSRYKSGVDAATRSIDMAKGTKWSSFAVMPYIERGINYSNLNQFEEAIEDFQAAIKIAESKKRDDWKMRALSNLAATYGMMKQYQSENSTIQSALMLARKFENPMVIASLTANLGNNLLAMDRNDDATLHFELANEIAQEHQLWDVIAIANTGIGDVLVDQKDYDQARERFETAKKIYETAGDRLGVISVQSRLSAIAEGLSNVTEVEHVEELNELVDEAKHVGNGQLVISLLEQLIVVHRRNQDWELLSDSLLQKQAVEREIWARQSAANENLLVSERVELTKQKQKSNLLLQICVMLVVVATVATFMWRRKRLDTHKLMQDNAQIRQNERLRILQEREAAQKEKFESMTMMSAGVIHDFNNYLSVIVSTAEVGKLVPELGEKDEFFESILKTGMSASEMTRNLSDFIGHGKVSDSTCDLRKILLQEEDFLRQLLNAASSIVVEIPDHSVFVQFESVQIKRIVSNLVKNAAEAIGPVAGTIRVHLRVIGKYCYLIVRDTGCGMDEETLNRATDPFFSDKGVGRGLGLASVKGVVERNGGSIEIQSKPGAGCEVTIRMAVTQDLPEVDGLEIGDLPEVEISQLPFRKILFVEDDVQIGERVRDFLERFGCDIDVIGSGELAITKLEAGNRFDCIITDFLLTDLSGRFVAKSARAICPGTPVVLVSGYAEQDVFESDLFDDFISKPFRLDDLVVVLNRLAIQQNQNRRAIK